MLDTLKSTSMGLDSLPDWFIRLAAPAFAQPLTHLFNLSLQQSLVPHQWNLEVQLHHTFAKGQLPSCVSRLPSYFCHSHSIQANGKIAR